MATQTVNTLSPLGVHTYEILNEVNSAGSSAGTYTNTVLTASQYESILQAAYPAIKAADPTATVLFSGLDMSKDSSGYLQGVYTAGGKNYFERVEPPSRFYSIINT